MPQRRQLDPILKGRIIGRLEAGEDIQRNDWPAMSPDLNPIEHAWYALGRRVAAHQPLPRTLPALRNALRLEWEQLPAELLNHLIEGMPRCCDACVAIRSNHTPY
ncbi:hypothetical protein ANN_26753 [Periplaneta americana]|uniref:Tc1-like transposase DDE domain-containing protein n=1 Tax=Periplaneta americana TaxID=6978 RepID=A0ABQ8RYZ4_PERAM|nr:hypothetical protein ANN_26753 [Periplaneta americana]